jgi:hypothetical protein
VLLLLLLLLLLPERRGRRAERTKQLMSNSAPTTFIAEYSIKLARALISPLKLRHPVFIRSQTATVDVNEK